MTLKTQLMEDDIQHESSSMRDRSGRVFYWHDRVFRAIYDAATWDFYKNLIQSPVLQALNNAGLIETWIPDDVALEGCAGVLEHKKIDFTSVVSEWTFHMLWEAAKVYLDLAIILEQNAMTFTDGHPWNILFDYCKPVMIDFGSIVPGDGLTNWENQFCARFVIPLAAYKNPSLRRLAKEFLYEHTHGLGLSLVNGWGSSIFPLQFRIFIKQYKRAKQKNIRAETLKALNHMRAYLETLQPPEVKETWANYVQMPEGEASGQKRKTNAVLDVLKEFRPETVLDMGANKGWYTFLAESQGCKVIAFDYEDYCVNQIYFHGKESNSRVLPLRMSFLLPTPEMALGLTIKNAYDRYRSDVTLALGLTHHLCLTQKMPFSIIAEIITRFTKNVTVVEFVHPDDKHISKWVIPADYSQEHFVRAMQRREFELVKETNPIPTRSILVFRRKSGSG